MTTRIHTLVTGAAAVLLTAAALTLAVSCQKDEEDSRGLTFTLVADDAPDSGKAYVESNYLCWHNGDKLKINNVEKGIAVSTSESTVTATITGVDYNENGYVAAFPASSVGEMGSGSTGAVTISVPATQVYSTAEDPSGNAVQVVPMPMVGRCAANGSTLEFSNAAALLKVTVSGEGMQVYKIVVSTTDGVLSGSAEMSAGDEEENKVLVPTSETGNSVTLDCSGSLPGPGDFYLVVAPFENKAVTVTVWAKDASSQKYAITKTSQRDDLTIGRNQIGPIPITIGADADKVNFWGSGNSAADPYLITDQTDLEALRTVTNAGTYGYCSGKYYKQTADITLSSWTTAIGNTGSYRFQAHYDGNNHSITNMNNKCCLFGYAGGGSIKNLSVSGTVSKGGDTQENIGGIVANVYGSAETIDHCTSEVNITLNYAGTSTSGVSLSNNGIGGIVGIANAAATISNCYNRGTITHNPTKYGYITVRIGGILGYNYNGGTKISYCYNEAALSSVNTSSYGNGAWGGICAYSKGSLEISYCENNAAITNNYNSSTASFFGGILGELELSTATVTIDHCTNNGMISVSHASNNAMRIGGIFACPLASKKTTITNCTNDAQLTTGTIHGNTNFVGGIIAYAYSGELEISDCTNGSVINGITLLGYNVGGICCSTAVAVTVERVVNNMSVSCSTNSGGIIGKAIGGTITSSYRECTNFGTISGNSGYIGGITGSCAQISSYIKCLNKGTISGTSRMGGIVGNAGSANKTFNKCLNDGNITVSGTLSDQSIGGIVGYLEANSATILNCGNNKAITGTKNAIGGLIGYYRPQGNSTPQIKNSYSIGNITAGTSNNQYGAGIVGCINRNSSGTITMGLTNCYYNGTVTGYYRGNMTGNYSNQSYNGSTITDCYALVGAATASNGKNTTLLFDSSKNRESGDGTYWSGTTTLLQALNDWVEAQGEESGYESWVVKDGIVTLNIIW